MTLVEKLGQSAPIGATVYPAGVNFSLYSRDATGVELLFFDHEDDSRPSRIVSVDPIANRTYHYWHTFVPGIRAGQIYAYRVRGPFAPADGLRFDPTKAVLDPYGRGVVVPRNYDREAASAKDGNTASAMKSVVVDPCSYDWESDTPLRNHSTRTIIYELKALRQRPGLDELLGLIGQIAKTDQGLEEINSAKIRMSQQTTAKQTENRPTSVNRMGVKYRI